MENLWTIYIEKNPMKTGGFSAFLPIMGHSPYRAVMVLSVAMIFLLAALSHLLNDYLWFAKFEIVSAVMGIQVLRIGAALMLFALGYAISFPLHPVLGMLIVIKSFIWVLVGFIEDVLVLAWLPKRWPMLPMPILIALLDVWIWHTISAYSPANLAWSTAPWLIFGGAALILNGIMIALASTRLWPVKSVVIRQTTVWRRTAPAVMATSFPWLERAVREVLQSIPLLLLLGIMIMLVAPIPQNHLPGLFWILGYFWGRRLYRTTNLPMNCCRALPDTLSVPSEPARSHPFLNVLLL